MRRFRDPAATGRQSLEEMADPDGDLQVEGPLSTEPRHTAPRVDLRIVVALLVVVAILAYGLARRGKPREQPEATTVTKTWSPRSVISVGKNAFRLDDVEQKGDDLTLRFGTTRGIDAARIASIIIDVRLSDARARISPTPIIEEGNLVVRATLPRGDQLIRGLRIVSLESAIPATWRWDVDFSRIWPIDSGQVRSLALGVQRKIGDRLVTLESVVATRGRIQAIFDSPHVTFMRTQLDVGSAQIGVDPPQIESDFTVPHGSSVYVFFEPVAPSARPNGVVVLGA